MSKLLILIFLMILPIFSQAFIRIGNNGEGVLVNGKVYLLDLFEAGIHLEPYIASSSIKQEQLERHLGLLPMRFPSEIALLKLKILDIEQKFPGLGIAIVDSLKSYFVEFSDDRSLFERSSSENIVIAVRRSEAIVIWKQQWDKMDSANRVALLVHEGIYSLAKVKCKNLFSCFQVSKRIRPIVGALFNKSLDSVVLQAIRNELNVSSLFGICQKVKLEAAYTLYDGSKRCDGNSCLKLAERANSFPNESAESFADRFWICAKAHDLQSMGFAVRVEYRFKKRGISILKEYYSVADEGAFQHSTFTVESELNDRGDFDFIDKKSCQDTLFSHRNSLTLLEFDGPFYPKACMHTRGTQNLSRPD